MSHIFGHFFFLNMLVKLPNSELFHGRNCICFSLILSQYVYWFYSCPVWEIDEYTFSTCNFQSSSLFFPNKVSERELLKIAEVRWWGALRIPVFCPLPGHPLSAYLVIALGLSIENYWQTEMISIFPSVGMAGENTPFLYLQAPRSPQGYPHSRTHKCLFFLPAVILITAEIIFQKQCFSKSDPRINIISIV